MDHDEEQYASDPDSDGDNDAIMDHCAVECMHAMEAGDKDAFRDSFHVLVADVLNKMGA